MDGYESALDTAYRIGTDARIETETGPEAGAASVPTVSVVVCAYTMQRWDLLREALESVRSQTVPALETLLVVDHCAELFRAATEEFGSWVEVIENVGAQGLSGARNSGVATARGDVVAFLDDDAAAAPDWLAELSKPYADPSVMGVGGHVEPRWASRRPHWFPHEFQWIVGCSYRGQPQTQAPVRNPIGANMSFRRQAMVEVGGFSGSVGRVGTRPLGCEETELSIRVARWAPGCAIVLRPQAVVQHHVPRQRTSWTYFRQRCWSEGLSKAAVSSLTDPRAALAAERSYVLTTLPSGAATGVRDAVRSRDADGIRRALAICAGLAITTAGYLKGRATLAGHVQPEHDAQQREDS